MLCIGVYYDLFGFQQKYSILELLLESHNIYKIFFALCLKHSSFWPSADVKYISDDLAHLCTVCLASLYVYYDLYAFQQNIVYWHDFKTVGLEIESHGTYKIFFALCLKHSSFWPSAGVKYMSDDLALAMP